ncbi:cyclic nucleotide-binding/CBS domain-containing protein [Chloroflexota bacterium]
MKLRDLLKIKDFKYRGLITIGSNESITVAIQKLTEHDRGSLPVCDDKGELVGIITERDVVRKCFACNKPFEEIKVISVMTKEVAVGNPDDDLDYAISVMKQKRIRHLPIVDCGKVTGMISMRDLLGVQLEETKAEIQYINMLPRRSRPGGPRLT